MDLQSQLTLAIDAKTVQAALANFSFLTLFGTLIFYWIQTSFSDFSFFLVKPRNQLNVSSFYPVPVPPPSQSEGGGKKEQSFGNPLQNKGLELGGPEAPSQSQKFSLTVSTGMIASNILLGLLLLLRWKESGHFPLSNLYESLMFLSWCFTFIHLVIENYTFSSSLSSTPPSLFQFKTSGFELAPRSQPSVEKEGWGEGPTESWNRKNRKNKIPNLLGAITTPSALFTNAFATFTLPKEMQEAAPLVPALQSNWLMMHVTVMILSYAALIIGSLLSIAFLVVTLPKKSMATGNEGNEGQSLAFILDNLSYRILGIGFPFLTIGILSGAVWANEAWGSYWSWDPKETWALLTWLIFAIYLHTRISKGWEGKKPAIIASFGFVVVWICYLGVNLIGEGLHSYGWFS
jgi:cytochrome c-type biogenesis protein CcsB